MEMQKAEQVPGMIYRGRKVYLEQRGQNNEQVEADLKNVRRDCLHFALQVRELQKRNAVPNLIIRPNQNYIN